MKIWQLDPANLTPYYDKAICSALASNGQVVRFFTTKYIYDTSLNYPDTFTVDYHYFQYLEYPALANLSFLRRGLRGVSYPLDHWRFLQLVKKHQPDVLHIQWSRLPLIDTWLIKQIQNLGIPVIHTVHDVVPLFSQNNFTGRLSDVFSQVDALVVHTQDSYQQVIKEYPKIIPERVHIIPLIAEEVFIPQDATREKARSLLHIHDNAPVLLFFGNIKHYKGIDLLPEIFQLVKQVYPDLELWVVGRPDAESDKIQVDHLKQIDGVHVRDTFIPYEDLWIYHFAADVAIYPYRNIFQSAALTAGLSFGCPVIVSDVGGLPEGVDGNGWVVPPENPQAFADAIVEALADKSKLQMMGKRSKEIIDERFGAEAIAKQHTNLYKNLIDGI